MRFFNQPDPNKVRDVLYKKRIKDKEEAEQRAAEEKQEQDIKENLEKMSGHDEATIGQILSALGEINDKNRS